MSSFTRGLLLMILPVVITGCGESTPAEKQAQLQSNVDAQAMTEAQTAVEQSLRDPSSAQFGLLTIAHIKGEKFDLPFYVCGSVNAKNGFGGYSGQQSFIVYTLIPKISGASPVVDWRPRKDFWGKCGKTIDAQQEAMHLRPHSGSFRHRHKYPKSESHELRADLH